MISFLRYGSLILCPQRLPGLWYLKPDVRMRNRTADKLEVVALDIEAAHEGYIRQGNQFRISGL